MSQLQFVARDIFFPVWNFNYITLYTMMKFPQPYFLTFPLSLSKGSLLHFISLISRPYYCPVFLVKWGGESQGMQLYKLLTFHMILENSQMSVTIYTLASAYLREIHSICSRGSGIMTF